MANANSRGAEAADRQVLFLALDTYSRLGGLQRFNQRVVGGLEGIARTEGWKQPRVHLMRDTKADIPEVLAQHVVGFGPNRLKFVKDSIIAARNSDLVMLGQLNLLPLSPLLKLSNPALKIILFVHGIEVWNDPAYRRKRFYEPALLKFVDRVAAVSRHTAERMQREFGVPSASFFLIPNAVDGPLYSVDPSQSECIFLSVTRMAAHDHGKNLDAVLRAFASLSDRRPEARLEIVGDGVLRPELEELAHQLGLRNRVTFLGRVSDAELEACYQRARGFVLPSSKEGFGIVYLEAWKYGIPVICGRLGASHEVVTDGEDGFIVDETSDTELSNAMLTLLDNPTRAREMGRAGLEKVKRSYLDGSFRTNLLKLMQESMT